MCAERLPTMGDSYLVGAVVSVCVVCDRLIRCRFAPTAARARQAYLRMYEEPGALGSEADVADDRSRVHGLHHHCGDRGGDGADGLARSAQPLGFRHQRLAGLDHGLNLFRQRVAGSLRGLPVRALVLVDLDLLAALLAGAIRTSPAADDGADGLQTQTCLVSNPAQRLAGLLEFQGGRNLSLAGRGPRSPLRSAALVRSQT